MKKPTVLSAHSQTDLLAAVPCVLGFEPEESLVMLTFGARRKAFHARVDLPTEPDELADAVDSLVRPAVANEVDGVVIVAYTQDRAAACRAADALAFALAGRDIWVAEMLLAQGDRFWTLWPDDRDAAEPQRFDAQSHRFRAEVVLHGRVVHESRDELAATLDPCPSEDVTAAIARTREEGGPDTMAESLWLHATLPALARERGLPTGEVSARVLVALDEPELLEVALAAMDAGEPDHWLDLWRHLLRCAPPSLSSAPAALLAFAAWRAGQGALAWCAVDRCHERDPDHPLATMVAGLLEHAVPPSVWA